jgi:hypothetical protein
VLGGPAGKAPGEHMDCAKYRDAIQELADGTLGSIRKAELQMHLDQCPDCRALAADLIKIRDAASGLEPIEPPEGAWLQIAGRLRQEGRVEQQATPAIHPRHRSMIVLAIAASLVLAVGLSIYLLLPRHQNPAQTAQVTPGNAAADDPVKSLAVELQLADQHTQNAIAKLEEALKSNANGIDPQVAELLQKDMKVMDQAIAESRAAIAADPANTAARDSLFDALRRKAVMLQDTIALMNEMRRGNAAGAAQIVEGLPKS